MVFLKQFFNSSRYLPWLQALISFFASALILAFTITLSLFFTSISEKDSEEFYISFNSLVPVLLEEFKIPGASIAIVKEGKISFIKSYGVADIESGRKMTPATPCRLESISKSLTAWGVMKLVEDKKIHLDSPVQQYLKSWSFPASDFSEEKITVRQLLSHSAGMSLGTIGVIYDPEEPRPGLKENLSADAILRQEPGRAFFYSNAGYNVLELMIQEVTGKDFAVYMKEEVLDPLDMKNASFDWLKNFDPPVPNGYTIEGEPVPVYVYPNRAAGGLFANVEEVAHFVLAGMPDYSQKGLHVLKKENIEELHKPQVEITGAYALAFDAYGFGHFIEFLPEGIKAVSHGGQGTGWMTHFHLISETGDGMVILTNSQRSWPFFAILLREWSHWRGFSGLGMQSILTGLKLMWLLNFVLLFLIFWRGFSFVLELISKKRQFNPLQKGGKKGRVLKLILVALLAISLIWASNQEYLMISSLFPKASLWLAYLCLLLLILLLLQVLFPKKETGIQDQQK